MSSRRGGSVRRLLGRIAIGIPIAVAALLLLLTAAAAAYDAVTSTPSAPIPPPDAHGHEIRTGNVVTRYEAWGHRGPVLLLIPGFVESSFVWDRVGPLLGKRFRIYAPDIRGFGYTTHHGPYSLPADTAQIVAFLRALRLDAAHNRLPIVVGHSSGAAIAANLSLLHPSMIAGIVMLDGDGTSAGAGPDWVHRLIVDPFFTAALRLTLSHPAIPRAIWMSVCGPRCPPLAGRELEGWLRPFEVPGAEAALKAIARAPLIGLPPSRLAAIHVPAAVMLGRGDPTITVARAHATATWLHSRIVVAIPGARHLPMISAPRVFVRDLARTAHRLRQSAGLPAT